ncbi:hypothetical protein SSX86_016372 [Deinandra increscens subsp. villosa]|uniref:Uncharacterized protein n=1 Tax=Deinandra increscens subsp. villosa TaxID=3103831 RepID=A0AAP0D586_9ASTR
MGPSPDMTVWERRLLYCVPVPGQNLWADVTSDGVANTFATLASREKRQRDDCSVYDEVEKQDLNNVIQDSPSAKKMVHVAAKTPKRHEHEELGTFL